MKLYNNNFGENMDEMPPTRGHDLKLLYGKFGAFGR